MLKKIMSLVKKFITWYFILSIGIVILYKWIPIPLTFTMISRSAEMLFSGEKVVWKHHWKPIENISPNLVKAVVASEDNLFIAHHGFDIESMKKAYKNNKKGKRIKGGSTISQQTAKNVFLWQGRNYIRKGFEVYFTFLTELLWSKKRIMEVYLNSIEMGKGIYGAEAASQYWYHKSANKLTSFEAAGIAAILPNPRKYKATNSSNYITKRKNKIVNLMEKIGPIQLEDKPNPKKK